MKNINNNLNIKRLENQLISTSKVKNNIKRDKNFEEILESIQNRDSEIKFSKHAVERLSNRNMNLNLEEIKRLKNAFQMAESKGVKDALIIMDDKAFIASINNKVIVTTMNKEQLKDNVFTNIDGAVII
ncbi:MAG: flagellar protein [Tissierellia bacterium]|nr:flagellar protein [Tissierellia bacterium]